MSSSRTGAPSASPSIDALLNQLEVRARSGREMGGGFGAHLKTQLRDTRDLGTALTTLFALDNQGRVPSPHLFSLLLRKATAVDQKIRLFSIIPTRTKDAVLYSNYISTENLPFPEAQRAFTEACMQNAADGGVYSGFIRVAGKCGKVVEAGLAFQRGLEKFRKGEKISPERCRIYNDYLQAMSITKQFDALQKAFADAEEEGIADKVTYTTAAIAAKRIGNAELGEQIAQRGRSKGLDMSAMENYEQTKANRKESEGTHKRGFVEMGESLDINDSLSTQALLERLDLQRQKNTMEKAMAIACDDAIASARDLKTALRIVLHTPYGYFRPTRNVFSSLLEKSASRAEKERLFSLIPDKDCVHYTIYIGAKEISFAEAKRAFEEADRKKIADAGTYCRFLEVAGESKEFAAAESTFQTAIGQPYAPKERIRIYNVFIHAAATAGHFDAAERAFTDVVKERIADSYTYSTFIAAAVREQRLRLAKDVLKQAEGAGCATTDVRNSFLSGAKYCDEFGDIEGHLEGAIKERWANARTYNIALDVVGKKSDFGAAERIFEKATANFIADHATYGTYIQIAARLGFWATALKTLERARPAQRESPAAYNNLLLHVTHEGHFADAESEFALACRRKVANAATYTIFIRVAGNLGHFSEAAAAFAEGRLKWPKDVQLYDAFVEACGKTEQRAAAGEAFGQAIAEGAVDEKLYQTFIGAIGADPQRFPIAQRALDRAIEQGDAGPKTCLVLIDSAGRAGSLDTAKKAFDKAKEKQWDDAQCHAAWIIALGRCEGVASAEKAFDAAALLYPKSSEIYTSFLEVAIRTKNLPLAKQIFDRTPPTAINFNMLLNALSAAGEKFEDIESLFHRAVWNDAVDPITFTSFITIAGIKRFQDAKVAFDIALKRGIKDPQLATSILDIASKAGEFEAAQEIFNKATEGGYRDMKMCDVYIDCLVRQKKDLEAEKLFSSSKFSFRQKEEGGMRYLDLHTYSHGTGFIAVKSFAEECRRKSFSTFGVITGKGNEQAGNFLAFRDELIALIEGRGGDLSAKKCLTNPGRVICTLLRGRDPISTT